MKMKMKKKKKKKQELGSKNTVDDCEVDFQ